MYGTHVRHSDQEDIQRRTVEWCVTVRRGKNLPTRWRLLWTKHKLKWDGKSGEKTWIASTDDWVESVIACPSRLDDARATIRHRRGCSPKGYVERSTCLKNKKKIFFYLQTFVSRLYGRRSKTWRAAPSTITACVFRIYTDGLVFCPSPDSPIV